MMIDRRLAKRIVHHGGADVVEKAEPLAQALLSAGLEIMEITFRTKVEQALALGCKLLKFFPAEAAGGVKMLKSLAGPYAHTGVKFTPTGGITAENLQDYLKLPVVAAIGGSWMVSPALIKEDNWAEIAKLTKEALDLAAKA